MRLNILKRLDLINKDKTTREEQRLIRMTYDSTRNTSSDVSDDESIIHLLNQSNSLPPTPPQIMSIDVSNILNDTDPSVITLSPTNSPKNVTNEPINVTNDTNNTSNITLHPTNDSNDSSNISSPPTIGSISVMNLSNDGNNDSSNVYNTHNNNTLYINLCSPSQTENDNNMSR